MSACPLVGTPPLRNPMKPLEILSQDQLMAVHEASMNLLENIGIEFMGQAARDKFRAAGATVDDSTGLGEDPAGTGGGCGEDRALDLRPHLAQSAAHGQCRRQLHFLRPGGRAAQCA